MLNKMCLIYIGYLTTYGFGDPVLLCISDDKIKVKYYLRNVRKLDKKDYIIKEVALDFESAMNLYEDYILQEYEEDCLFLTNQDIEYLNKEIQNTILHLEDAYEKMKSYCNLISKVPKLKDDWISLMKALKIMESELSKVKTLRKICIAELKDSPIFSSNILEYLQHIGYLQEDKELTELFYRKVYEE